MVSLPLERGRPEGTLVYAHMQFLITYFSKFVFNVFSNVLSQNVLQNGVHDLFRIVVQKLCSHVLFSTFVFQIV